MINNGKIVNLILKITIITNVNMIYFIMTSFDVFVIIRTFLFPMLEDYSVYLFIKKNYS